MAQRTKLTPKRVSAIVSTLADGLSISSACEAAGIARPTYYEWLAEEPDFAAKVEAAIETGTDRLEEIARRRAADSSDTLLIFLLKARRPGVYRETTRHELTGADGAALTVTVGMRPDGPPEQ